MRIAFGGMMHESNSFNPIMTGLSDFSVQRGEEIVSWWGRAHHEVGGFIEGASKYGYDLAPLIMAAATPGGTVTAEAFEALLSELIQRLVEAGPVDGLLLALHGAMVCEAFPDADGEVARRIREVAGVDLPIVVTNDLHANVSEKLVDQCTALVIYKTYPHVDQRERGLQAAEILSRTIKGEIRPVQAMIKPPLLLNIVCQNTNAEPVKSIMSAVRAAEHKPGVLAASLAEGYQYADVHEMGPSVVVVTDGDRTLAASEAQRLADLVWNARGNLMFRLPGAREAVEKAVSSDCTPVVLVDMGDNIGGGSAGDSTFILSEILRQKANGWLVVLADPGGVQACVNLGVNATVTLEVGGKTDNLHGAPVRVAGRVKSLHDGRYIETAPRHGGQRYRDQGLTAVLEIAATGPEDSGYLVLTSRREPPFSLNQVTSLGILPEQRRIIVVKAAIAYRAAYEPIAGTIIEVDTAGLTAVNPARFTFRHVRPGLHGLA